MADKEKFFKCSCYGEGMFVTKFEGESEFYFSMWTQGHYPRNMSLRQRIRLVCKIIWTGEAWGDELILDKDKAKELAEWISLNSNAKN